MPNMNGLKQVVHEKKVFKGFCYINLYIDMYPNKGVSSCEPRDFHVHKLHFPGPKDAPCELSIHSGEWFMRRRF